MRKIDLTLPAYLTLKQYKAMDEVYSLDDNLQTLYTISAVSGIEIDEVKKWDIPTITAVWNTIKQILDDSSNIEFYPILEFEGTQYGFTPMSKMSVAEYIDLDNLAKDKTKNLTDILSILYRPIKSHTIKDIKFKTKSTLKLIFTKESSEHLMDYYEVEDYNNELRKKQAKLFDEFPASVALGALSFFFRGRQSIISRFPNLYSPDIQTSEESDDEERDRTIQEHYGWLNTLYELGKTPILSIGGENNLLTLNIVFVLNYMSMIRDIDIETAKRRKEAMNQNKIK